MKNKFQLIETYLKIEGTNYRKIRKINIVSLTLQKQAKKELKN